MSTQNTNRLAKNTIMLYVRMAFGMCVSLYTSRVVLNTLGVEDFGIYNVVAGVVSFLSFLSASLQTATQRFLNVALGQNDVNSLRQTYSISIIIHIGLAGIILVIGESIGLWFLYNKLIIPDERFIAALWVYQFTLISTIGTLLTIPFNAEVIAHERMDVYAYLSILDIILKLVIVYLLYISPLDKLISYGFLYLLTTLLNRGLFVIYCKRNFLECNLTKKINRGIFKEMVTFASWDIFGVIASVCSVQGTTILVNMFFGPIVNAAKAIAEQVKGAVSGFSSNFLLALNPQITKAHAGGDYSYMFRLTFSGAKIAFTLLYTIVLPLSIKAQYILELWLSIVPDYTTIFLRIVLIEMVLEAMMNPFHAAALATGKIKEYGFLTSIITIMIVPAAYFVLKLGGDPISVYMTLITITILREIIQFVKLRKLISFSYLKYFKEVHIRTLFVVSITLPICIFLESYISDSILNLLYFSFICCSTSLLSCYCFVFDKQEKYFIKEKIKIVIQKTIQ